MEIKEDTKFILSREEAAAIKKLLGQFDEGTLERRHSLTVYESNLLKEIHSKIFDYFDKK